MQNYRLKLKILLILLLTATALLVAERILAPKPPPLTKREFSEELLGGRELAVKSPEDLEIILVGDIMLSRHVGTQMAKANDWTLPFKKTRDYLLSADITFGNLESPFLDSGPQVTEGLSFKAEPEAVAGLTQAGFDIVSLANNHAFDRGREGITFTREHLLKNNILSIGAGTNEEETFEPQIIEVNGQKIGFLAFTYFKKPPFIADLDLENLKSRLANLKPQADFIIVSLHAGEEYTHEPTEQQKTFARAAIDAGADIVAGHHPHWVQPVEIYKSKPIFYSLGNFVFDQEWSQETKEGLIAKIQISNSKIRKIELVPIIIENFCCPRFANEQESIQILRSINATSTYIFPKN